MTDGNGGTPAILQHAQTKWLIESSISLSVQTNTLSPMLLAFLLIPLLKRTISKPFPSRDGLSNPWPPRIIFNGSRLHVIAEKNRLDPQRPLQGLNDASGWHNPSRYAITKVRNPSSFQRLVEVANGLQLAAQPLARPIPHCQARESDCGGRSARDRELRIHQGSYVSGILPRQNHRKDARDRREGDRARHFDGGKV